MQGVEKAVMNIFIPTICFLSAVAIGSTACHRKSSVPEAPAQTGSSAKPVTDYLSLLENLRVAKVQVEEGEEVSQPFFSVKGRIIRINGEDVQVFQYTNSEAANAQAAEVSPTGSKIGTSSMSWLAPPHFYEREKLIVLYVGSSGNVIDTLKRVLGQQFAGQ